jgi:hypothetical protein
LAIPPGSGAVTQLLVKPLPLEPVEEYSVRSDLSSCFIKASTSNNCQSFNLLDSAAYF